MDLDGKSSQQYPVNAGVSQGSILGPTLFVLYINDLSDVICDVAIYADDNTLYSKCDQASDLWDQLELVSEIGTDLRDTVDWGKVSLLGKLSWFCLTSLITLILLMWKQIGLSKSSFKMLKLTFSFKFDYLYS